MINVSQVMYDMPQSFKTPLQELAYKTLNQLNIPFARVENDEAISMEDCEEIDKRLENKTVKTLFLCNRQQTSFYLFVTPANKPFKTKNFSSALSISRVSFAPQELLQEMLETVIGATTVFSILADSDNKIQLVIEKEVLENEWYGCSDGTTTGYMKFPTKNLVQDLIPFSKHDFLMVDLPRE